MELKTYAADSNGYRFGFGGMEKDDEIKGSGNSLDFGARIYDSRLGRWLALDPLMKEYPSWSPYLGIGNSPILYIDIDGREIIIPNTVIKHDGPALPKTTAELGNTTTDWCYEYNKETKEFDITVQQFQVYSSSLSSIDKENPGVKEFIIVHEGVHITRTNEAMYKDISVTMNINGKEKTYAGRADHVLTDYYNNNYQPRLNKINSDRTDAHAAINQKYTTAIKDAMNQGDNEKASELLSKVRAEKSDYDNNTYNVAKQNLKKEYVEFTSLVRGKVIQNDKNANVHTGDNNVGIEAAAKMETQEAKDYQTSDKNPIKYKEVIIENVDVIETR